MHCIGRCICFAAVLVLVVLVVWWWCFFNCCWCCCGCEQTESQHADGAYRLFPSLKLPLPARNRSGHAGAWATARDDHHPAGGSLFCSWNDASWDSYKCSATYHWLLSPLAMFREWNGFEFGFVLCMDKLGMLRRALFRSLWLLMACFLPPFCRTNAMIISLLEPSIWIVPIDIPCKEMATKTPEFCCFLCSKDEPIDVFGRQVSILLPSQLLPISLASRLPKKGPRTKVRESKLDSEIV